MAKKTIYLVDEEIWGKMMHMALEGAYVIKEFNGVDEALDYMGWTPEAAHLTRNLPDVIVTENDTLSWRNKKMVQSEYDGLTLLRAAREAGIARAIVTHGPQGAVMPPDHKTVTSAQVLEAGGKETVLFYKTQFIFDGNDNERLVEIINMALATMGKLK